MVGIYILTRSCVYSVFSALIMRELGPVFRRTDRGEVVFNNTTLANNLKSGGPPKGAAICPPPDEVRSSALASVRRLNIDVRDEVFIQKLLHIK